MGDEADNILSSLGLSNDDKKSYDTAKYGGPISGVSRSFYKPGHLVGPS